MNKERIKYFFDNIDIKDDDIARAEKAIYSKGIEKHIIILEMLKPWVGGEKVPYEFIASFYRYDKRLRKVLFVFISYLEEYYRSLILDRFRFDWKTMVFDLHFKYLLDKYKDMDKAIEKIEFSNLLNLVYKNCESFNDKYVFPNCSHLKKNKEALVELRNSVMHNRLLLLYRGYKECYVGSQGLKSTTLKDNITNLVNFLPKQVKEKCRKEINDCLLERNNVGKTKWDVPLIIQIII